MRGQGGLAAGAVGHDLVALVEQPALVDLRQRPPHRLDVGLIQRAVGALEVQPEADPLGQPVPVLQEREHRRPALGVEALDPHLLLDLGLGGDAELLFDGDLHRQPVAVPAALAFHVAPPHRLKAGVDVLEHAREHVVGARRAVGRRRALVEDPPLAARAAAQRLGEHVPGRASAPGPPARARAAAAAGPPRGGGSADVAWPRPSGGHCRWAPPARTYDTAPCACACTTTTTARASPTASTAPAHRWRCCTRVCSRTWSGSRWWSTSRTVSASCSPTCPCTATPRPAPATPTRPTGSRR